MALQIWLPLTKNDKNVGLNNVALTNNGATIDSEGKIGNCYAFNGTSNCIYGTINVDCSKLSTCCWLYVNTTTPSYQYVVSLNNNSGYGDQAIAIALSTSSIVFCAGGKNSAMGTITIGEWVHLAVTYDGNTMRGYINGELVGILSVTTPLTKTQFTVGARKASGFVYYTDGKLSDVRFYDNCLTDEDVKDIYQSKVYQFSPQWQRNLITFGDASGVGALVQHTGHNITMSGDTMWVRSGTTAANSSYIEFKGLNLMSGGTVSLWVDVGENKPGVIYSDPSSKMVIYYTTASSKSLLCSTVSATRYKYNGVNGKLNHIVATYDSTRALSKVYINGSPASTTGSNNYVILYQQTGAIGCRLGNATAYRFTGRVGDIRVFAKQFTDAEVKSLYDSGYCGEEEDASGATWLRVLHHENPASNLFTTANWNNNNSETLFSKLYIFKNNDLLRGFNGKYEFMAKERLESGSTEQIYRWRQASNPTATTCSGYELISQTYNQSRSYGLASGPTGYTYFSNKSSWWCACGAVINYQGGIPGFGGVVKTGYVDLYVRVDKRYLPEGFTRLEYIESSGIRAQYIDTGIKPCMNKIRCVCDFTPLNENDTAFFGTRGTYYLFYKISGNYFWPISKCETIEGTLQVGEKYHVDWNKGTLEITGPNGVYQKGVRSNSTQDTTNLFIFNFNPTDTRATTARLYYFKIYVEDELVRYFVPCRQESDGAVGLYDVVSDAFFGSNADNFIAGPNV